MTLQLLWIVLAYGMAAAAVRLLHTWHSTFLKASDEDQKAGSQREHYIIMTSNHEHQVEWLIRMFKIRSWIVSSPVKVTVIDHVSEDLTVPIVERLQPCGGIELAVMSAASGSGQEVQLPDLERCTVVDLRQHESESGYVG